MSKSKKFEFRPDEYVVYPAHGVGQIVSIEEQEIAGITLELFVISFEKDKMTLRVPTNKATEIGMRSLSSPDVVSKAMTTLKGKAKVKRAMWSRRAQEYEQKINSGDLIAIAEVVRDLHRTDDQREQSYSERQLYEAALERLPLMIPTYDISTIGAGGGSIAWVDKSGLLQVGPESAGSDPGPVCYGLGSTRPTVTDANLVVGRINPDRPIGGKLDRLDIDAARLAIEADVARPLGLSIEDGAEAILRLANAKMAGAIRLVSIEKGHDPSKFAAMPFGGGGALHAGALIKEVGLGAALVPRFPGVTSALGCVVADLRHDRVQTVNRRLDQTDVKALGQEMNEVAEMTEVLISTPGARFERFERIERLFEFDMLYLGQTHTLSVPVPMPAAGLDHETIQTAFDAAYQAAYGRLLENIPVRLMNYRVTVIGRRPTFDMSLFAPTRGKPALGCRIGQRTVYADGRTWEAPVYERLDLEGGAVVEGPALLEQPDTTIFVDPGLTGRVDAFGNLLIAPKG